MNQMKNALKNLSKAEQMEERTSGVKDRTVQTMQLEEERELRFKAKKGKRTHGHGQRYDGCRGRRV